MNKPNFSRLNIHQRFQIMNFREAGFLDNQVHAVLDALTVCLDILENAWPSGIILPEDMTQAETILKKHRGLP